jgi:hypothetical protein
VPTFFSKWYYLNEEPILKMFLLIRWKIQKSEN